MQPWTSYLSSLSLDSLISKTEMIMSPCHRGVVRIKWDNTLPGTINIQQISCFMIVEKIQDKRLLSLIQNQYLKRDIWAMVVGVDRVAECADDAGCGLGLEQPTVTPTHRSEPTWACCPRVLWVRPWRGTSRESCPRGASKRRGQVEKRRLDISKSLEAETKHPTLPRLPCSC